MHGNVWNWVQTLGTRTTWAHSVSPKREIFAGLDVGLNDPVTFNPK